MTTPYTNSNGQSINTRPYNFSYPLLKRSMRLISQYQSLVTALPTYAILVVFIYAWSLLLSHVSWSHLPHSAWSFLSILPWSHFLHFLDHGTSEIDSREKLTANIHMAQLTCIFFCTVILMDIWLWWITVDVYAAIDLTPRNPWNVLDMNTSTCVYDDG